MDLRAAGQTKGEVTSPVQVARAGVATVIKAKSIISVFVDAAVLE